MLVLALSTMQRTLLASVFKDGIIVVCSNNKYWKGTLVLYLRLLEYSFLVNTCTTKRYEERRDY